MATKLTGLLNLTRIPKRLIGETKKGEKCIFIDIVPNRDGEDGYGNTHAVTLYDKEKRETIYLGNLKSKEFGGGGAAKTDPTPEEDALPF